MARNPRAKAQRETAARVREFRAGRGYRSVIPRELKGRAPEVRISYLQGLAGKDPGNYTAAERKQAASAASFGAHGKAGYEQFDTPEWREFWYHTAGGQ